MERKFKEKEEVWNKKNNCKDVFERYVSCNSDIIILNRCGTLYIFHVSDIEPYIGQDKIQKATEILRNLFAPPIEQSGKSGNIKDNPNESTIYDQLKGYPLKISEPHPFTVILKSGVKVGVSSTMFDYINEQGDDTVSVQTVEDGNFILSEIAAIVPTENLI